ncbi:hypothetical protein ACFQY5_15470 [Paeniroseomonas aquatica]|uniref:hypothetical protein n=1 Tax=Paeniroseomonas aquatica TaxID=373043 RepID=UPI00361E30C6
MHPQGADQTVGAFVNSGSRGKAQDRAQRAAHLKSQTAGLGDQLNGLDQAANLLAQFSAVIGIQCPDQERHLIPVHVSQPGVQPWGWSRGASQCLGQNHLAVFQLHQAGFDSAHLGTLGQGIHQLAELSLHPLQLLPFARETGRGLGLQPIPLGGESRGKIPEQRKRSFGTLGTGA